MTEQADLGVAVGIKRDVARSAVARDNLGNQLDEIERRFAPSYLSSVLSSLVRTSAGKHPVVWAVAGAAVVAALVGLVSWALLNDDD